MDAELEQDANRFWALVFEIVIDGEKRLATQLNAHNLTPPQFYVMKTLAEHGGRCPIGQIARLHHLTNATMTGLVKRLEAMQPPLVRREQSDTDRRSVDVVLTTDGEARFAAVQADFVAQLRTMLSLLRPSERQDLLYYLKRYVDFVAAYFPTEAMQLE